MNKLILSLCVLLIGCSDFDKLTPIHYETARVTCETHSGLNEITESTTIMFRDFYRNEVLFLCNDNTTFSQTWDVSK